MANSLTIELSVVSLMLIPEVRVAALPYLQDSWMFENEACYKAIRCLSQSKYSNQVPDLHSFVLDLHNNYNVDQGDCENIASLIINYRDDVTTFDDAIHNLQEWIKQQHVDRGIEIIAAGSDPNYKQTGIESIKNAVALKISADTFYDFSNVDSVRIAKEEDFPDGTHIIPSSFSLINKASAYGGLKFGDIVMCAAESGCHAINTPILIYDGSTKMSQNIEVGDQLVGPDSLPRIVKSLVRGSEEMYRINTKNGENFVVNGNHLLHLSCVVGKRHNVNGKTIYKSWNHEETNITVNDYLEKSNKWKKDARLVKSELVEFNYQNINLDPYFLGLLIGDGNYSTPTKVRFYASEIEIMNYVEGYINGLGLNFTKDTQSGCYSYYFQSKSLGKANLIIRELKLLGMTGSKARTKFIPNSYLRNNSENRLQLLAGLLDSDGYYSSKKGSYRFSSVSKSLAEQVQWLSRSLGLYAGELIVSRNKTGFSKDLLDSVSYGVNIVGDVDKIPSRIVKKMAGPNTNHKNALSHGIKSVKSLGVGDYYGWTVDKDHLYVDGNFFIHHNCGKSSLLVTEGAHFAKLGYKVANFVLGDNSEYDMFLKYLCNWTGLEITEILKNGYEKYMTPEIKSYFQNVRVKAYPPDNLDVYQLLAKADQLHQKFPFHILIVDYDANIKESSGTGNSYVEGGLVYANLKGYGKGKCVVYSASQTKIGHWGEEMVLKHMANDSSKKQHHLDIMLGLGRSQDCPSVGTLNIAKMRRGRSDVHTRVHLDQGRGMIREIRSEEYDAIKHRYKLSQSEISFAT